MSSSSFPQCSPIPPPLSSTEARASGEALSRRGKKNTTTGSRSGGRLVAAPKDALRRTKPSRRGLQSPKCSCHFLLIFSCSASITCSSPSAETASGRRATRYRGPHQDQANADDARAGVGHYRPRRLLRRRTTGTRRREENTPSLGRKATPLGERCRGFQLAKCLSKIRSWDIF